MPFTYWFKIDCYSIHYPPQGVAIWGRPPPPPPLKPAQQQYMANGSGTNGYATTSPITSIPGPPLPSPYVYGGPPIPAAVRPLGSMPVPPLGSFPVPPPASLPFPAAAGVPPLPRPPPLPLSIAPKSVVQPVATDVVVGVLVYAELDESMEEARARSMGFSI